MLQPFLTKNFTNGFTRSHLINRKRGERGEPVPSEVEGPQKKTKMQQKNYMTPPKEKPNPSAPLLRLPCDIREKCNSCRFVNISYESGLEMKYSLAVEELQKSELLKGVRLLVPQVSPQLFGYRATLKLAVRSNGGGLEIGLFKPGTHQVVDINSCPLHVAPLRRLLMALHLILNDLVSQGTLTAWDEHTRQGDLRYIVARASHLTGEIQLVFVVADESRRGLYRNIVRDLKKRDLNINSAFLNINLDVGNAIFGKQFVKLAGQDHLRVVLNGLHLSVSPASFLQVNPWQATALYRRIVDLMGTEGRGSVAWDLYCGIGPIAISLAKCGFRVWGMEENPTAIEDARANASRNEIPKNRIGFQSGRIEDVINNVEAWAADPSVIVVNPSRRGLADSVRKHLAERLTAKGTLQTLLYVSCDIKTLARDLEELTKSGARLRQIEAFDMFPHTEKLEWLAVLTQ